MSCCRKHKHRQALKEAVDKSRALVKQVMLEQGVPGAVVAVIKDGRLVWSEGVGLADVENDTPCTAESGEDMKEPKCCHVFCCPPRPFLVLRAHS